MIHKIASIILTPLIALTAWLSPAPSIPSIPIPVPVEVVKEVVREVPRPVKFGATFQTPSELALFDTTLAAGISASATSMTLTSATDKHGATLASSTYGFILDEGVSTEELILADCTGTGCTNLTRGISVVSATTTTSGFSHRRGASVKMTSAPAVVFLLNIFKGKQNIENILTYNSALTFTLGNQLITKTYADNLAIAGVPDMSATTKGIGEQATAAEAANTAAAGSGDTTAPLVLTTGLSTSTPGDNANRVIAMAGNGGRLSPRFFDPTGQYGFGAATTTFKGIEVGNLTASSTIQLGGSSFKINTDASSTATTTLKVITGTSTPLSAIFEPPDWGEIGEVTAQAATNTLMLRGLPQRKELTLKLLITGASVAINPEMTFNEDTANNYGMSFYDSSFKHNGAGNSAVASIGLAPGGAATTTQMYLTMNITNRSASNKMVDARGTGESATYTSFAPTHIEGTGIWTNTSAQITTIKIWTNSANNFNAGSRLTVYAPRN